MDKRVVEVQWIGLYSTEVSRDLSLKVELCCDSTPGGKYTAGSHQILVYKSHSHSGTTHRIGRLTASRSCVHPSPHDGQGSVRDTVLGAGSARDCSPVTVLREPMAHCGDSRHWKGEPQTRLQSSQQGRALGWDYRLEQSPEVMIPWEVTCTKGSIN